MLPPSFSKSDVSLFIIKWPLLVIGAYYQTKVLIKGFKERKINVIYSLFIVAWDVSLPIELLVKVHSVSLLELFQDLKEVMLTKFVIPREVEDMKCKLSPHERATSHEVLEHLDHGIIASSQNDPYIAIHEGNHPLSNLFAIPFLQMSFKQVSVQLWRFETLPQIWVWV